MEIVKHGLVYKPSPRKFTCQRCGCIFITGPEEYRHLFSNGWWRLVDEYRSTCPECKKCRVLALDEVPNESGSAFVEIKVTGRFEECLVRSSELHPEIKMHTAINSTGYCYTLDDSTYGIRWRCWTGCPSDEQRKNTPWEERVSEQ